MSVKVSGPFENETWWEEKTWQDVIDMQAGVKAGCWMHVPAVFLFKEINVVIVKHKLNAPHSRYFYSHEITCTHIKH